LIVSAEPSVMTNRITELDRQIARLERLEKPVCAAFALALAGAYFWWRLTAHHVLAVYTWMIPAFIGYVVPLFFLSNRTSALEQERRELTHGPPGVPEARVVERPATPPKVVPVQPIASAAPEPVEPPAAGDGPRFLT
jgi:hypothetical protein